MTGPPGKLRSLLSRRASVLLLAALIGGLGGLGVWASVNEDESPNSTPPRASTTAEGSSPATARRGHCPSPVIGPPRNASTVGPTLDRPCRRGRPGLRSHRSVCARTRPLGEVGRNRLEVPTNWSEVGWWRDGSLPGERGSSVIAGHVDTKTGPAVFAKLGRLRRGDEINFVRREGRTARFEVTRTERYAKRRFPTRRVYAESSKPVLRLITCGGQFDWSSGHYRDNVVVYARATSEPDPDVDVLAQDHRHREVTLPRRRLGRPPPHLAR